MEDLSKLADSTGQSHKSGWAFGLGLERIAMVLFSIPDIRLFWSQDARFLSQFRPGEITTFKPYSKYPECYKDMSFWLPPFVSKGSEGGSAAGGKGKVWHENDFCELVREVAGDLVESVRLVCGLSSLLDILPTWSEAADGPIWCCFCRLGDETHSFSTQIDDFTHPKTGKQSKCYRLNYRSMDRCVSVFLFTIP